MYVISRYFLTLKICILITAFSEVTPSSLVNDSQCFKGSQSRWRWDFPHLSRPAPRPTKPPVRWIQGIFRGWRRPGRGADHPPFLSAKMYKKNRTIPLRRMIGWEKGSHHLYYHGFIYLDEVGRSLPVTLVRMYQTTRHHNSEDRPQIGIILFRTEFSLSERR
jgi:hypothetical protein